jgi:mRNA degradation ribonuclease J1/J2
MVGVEEMGSNKILFKAAGTHVFLDFGMSYPREELFLEFPPLWPACIGDRLKADIFPRL